MRSTRHYPLHLALSSLGDPVLDAVDIIHTGNSVLRRQMEIEHRPLKFVHSINCPTMGKHG